jgi:hypothetical protein
MLNWQMSFVIIGFYPLILKSNFTSSFTPDFIAFVLISPMTFSSSLTNALQSFNPTRP